MTADHAGGILSACVAQWLVEPVGRRAAPGVCDVPLPHVPGLLKAMPESPNFFLVAKGSPATGPNAPPSPVRSPCPACSGSACACRSRALAVGRTSGLGRFGAVVGPWPGGQLLATGNGDRGFMAFALAGVSSLVFIGIAALRPARRPEPGEAGRKPVTSG
ncbi:hypothetical protein [Streptomyces sp. NPDC046870]|uniref:hypothetical protein n=1 Tax=Streptomyces sp. NPDC046870 TaxID=3155135 RepID=UPI0034556738